MELIDERRRQTSHPDDLFEALLETRETASGDPMLSEEDVCDEFGTMLVAGHETTAVALTWTAYLMVRHPEIQERVRCEINRVIGNRDVTIRDLDSLTLLSGCINEALRLYPPVWFLSRTCVEDMTIAGINIVANSAILVSPYTTHRHEDFWDEPEKFDPWRNHKGNRAFIPFGLGGHACVGRYLALVESAIILALVLRRYRLVSIEQDVVKPEPLITLRVKGGLNVKLESVETGQ